MKRGWLVALVLVVVAGWFAYDMWRVEIPAAGDSGGQP